MTAAALIAVAVLVEPSPLHLGKDARAKVRVEAAEAPTLSASAGRIENVRAAGAGSWAADYFPPDDELPQVAILTAVVQGEVAWTAIPLWGQGDAVVKTRPRGSIRVEIAGRTFGPVVADASGQAQVPVEVPPGVREAHHGKRIIPLNVPPSRTVHLALGRQHGGLGLRHAGARGSLDNSRVREGGPVLLHGCREVCPGLGQARLEIPPVELHEQIPRLHVRVVVDVDTGDVARHLWAHPDDVAIDERVVGGLVRSRVQDVGDAEHEQRQDCDNAERQGDGAPVPASRSWCRR